MAKKEDRKTIKYGEMNKLYDNQAVKPTVDMSEQNFTSLSRAAIKSNLVNSDMLQGRRLAFILQKIKPENTGFFDSLFNKPLAKYFVRIPELDAHLPEPETIGEPARKKKPKEEGSLSDQDIIELHSIYEPKSEDDTLSSLSAGDRVWVTHANGKNVILESLKSPPGANKGEGDVPDAKTKGKPFRGGSGGSGGFRGKISFDAGGSGLHPDLAEDKDLPLDVAKEIASLLHEGAGFSEQAIANILATIHVDSGFKPNSEMNFENATLEMTKLHWGSRLGSLSDEQIVELKKDYVKFYDHVYYGPARAEAENTTGEGGHEFRGRGYIHIPGKQFYKKIGIFVPAIAEAKDNLFEHQYAMMAVMAYYDFVVPEGKKDYEEFSKVYKITKGWLPTEISAENPSREYYIKDFEKRKKLTAAWLDYVKRNVTFSIQPTEFTVSPGGPMVAGSEEMRLATEAHNSFLASYLAAAPELRRNSDVVMSDKSAKQIDLEEVELSQLIQFPICSNGFNFIAPLQGIPDYGSEFLGVRGVGNHLAMDQFIPDSNMTTKVRAIGPGKVTAICHSTTYDNYCKQFQDLMKQHFYGKPEEADKAAEWRISKGYPVPASMLKAWKDHAQVTLPSNYGQMGWEELRTWMNSHVPNNSTKFGANFLRYMRATYGSFMHAGGASVTITYDPDHNGIVYTQYSCHMGEIFVGNGDRVEQGQVIGLIGTTAVFDKNCKHLHFQMESFENGSSIITGYGHKGRVKNRLNPREIIPALSINRNKTEIKYEGIYSPSGTHAAKQKSKIAPTVTTSGDYDTLEPYTENRVRIADGYEEIRDSNDPRLIEVPTVPGRATQKLHYLAAIRLEILILDAAAAGFPDVRIASGWRRQRFTSKEHYEEEMKKQYPNKTLREARRLVAYQSPHMTGLAIDFGNHGLEPRSATKEAQKNSEFFKWLKENAHLYGITPYKYEPWHWEVKIPTSAYASGEEFTQNYQVYVT